MNRIVGLAIGIVVASAVTADAGSISWTIPVYTTSGAVVMDLTCTETPGTASQVSDQYVFTIKDFGTVGGTGCNVMGGTWFAQSEEWPPTPTRANLYVATAEYVQDSNGDSPIMMPSHGDYFQDWTWTTTRGGHIGVQPSESRTSFMGFDSLIEGSLNPLTGNCVDGGGNPTFGAAAPRRGKPVLPMPTETPTRRGAI